jgi:hypothetical protein
MVTADARSVCCEIAADLCDTVDGSRDDHRSRGA